MKDQETDNLVTFPAAKNYNFANSRKEENSQDLIDELLSNLDDWDFEHEETEVEATTRFSHKIPHIGFDDNFIGESMAFDQVIDNLQGRIDELREAECRLRYYLSEIETHYRPHVSNLDH